MLHTVGSGGNHVTAEVLTSGIDHGRLILEAIRAPRVPGPEVIYF